MGIPIQLIRTYDSRDKRSGDFGVGWTLDIVRGRYTNNRKPGDGWLVANSPKTSIFPTIPCATSKPTKSHITEIRFSDTDFYRFAFQAQMSGYGSAIGGGCLGQASFVQIGGRQGATLEVLGDTDVFWPNGSNQLLGFATFQTYEPSDVLLTTPEGSEFELSLVDGIERIRDRNGNALTIGPDGITHSTGKSVAFTRDGDGRITRITDPMGNTLNYTYDGNGDLVSVTDQVGSVTRFTYNGKHDLLDIIDPRGIKAARNEYDGSGRLIAVIDADGNRTEFTHDIADRQEAVRDPRGNVTLYIYDTNGNVLAKTDSEGRITTYTYDVDDNQLSETNPLGQTISRSFDNRGNMLTETDALGNTIYYTYDDRNLPLSRTDARGNTATFAYDSHGNLLRATDSLQNITASTYDAKGSRTTTTDVAGNTLRYTYDENGNPTSYTNPAGHTATYTYDANGNRVTETLTRTVTAGVVVTMVTLLVYDGRNRLVQEVDAQGNVFRTEYNDLGFVKE